MFPTLSHLADYLFGFKIPIEIYTYSLFVVLAFVAAYFVFRSEFKRKERVGDIPKVKMGGKYVSPHKLCDNIVLIAIVFGFLGAKLFSLLEQYSYYFRSPSSQFDTPSGLTFYGGFLLVCFVYFIYGRMKGIKASHLADASCLGTLAGYGIGRLGCHLSGDGDWGIVNLNPKPTILFWLPDWAWSFRYPHNAIEQGELINNCSGKYCMILSEGVFPTSLYEFIFCLLLFSVLWFFRTRIKTPGLLSILYLSITAIERFFIEMIRVNPKTEILNMGFSQAQMIALGIIGFCMFWCLIILKNNIKAKLN